MEKNNAENQAGSQAVLVDLGAGPILVGAKLSTTSWNHLAVAVRKGFTEIYVNGILRRRTRYDRESFLQLGRGNVQLGARGPDYPGEWFVGAIDDVWILRGAATPEVIALLAEGHPPRLRLVRLGLHPRRAHRARRRLVAGGGVALLWAAHSFSGGGQGGGPPRWNTRRATGPSSLALTCRAITTSKSPLSTTRT